MSAGFCDLCLHRAHPGNPANAHTICVGNDAVPAHLDHADFVGTCSCDDGSGSGSGSGTGSGSDTTTTGGQF